MNRTSDYHWGMLILLLSTCGIACEGEGTGESSSSALPDGTWTPWLSRDTPSGTGDSESRYQHHLEGHLPCEHPTHIECSDRGSQKITCNPKDGLICENAKQEGSLCKDYAVRFFCPKKPASPFEFDPKPDPDPDKIVVGTLKGTAVVNQFGRVNYQVPLTVPPGTGGMSPELSLSYQSNGSANSILGQGFELTGPSMISRSPATMLDDGFIAPIEFDKDDQFSLDGQRLRKIRALSPVNGRARNQYQTKHDSSSRIVSHLDPEGQPLWFTVETKSGRVLRFGRREDARLGHDDNRTFGWYLDTVTDRFGNYMRYEYRDNLLRSIKYTGNSQANLKPYNIVNFRYASRPDVQLTYAAGLAVRRSDKRLVKIVVKANGKHVREYRIKYRKSPISGVSQLTSIQEVAGLEGTAPLSSARPATEFKWGATKKLGMSGQPFIKSVAPNSQVKGGIRVHAQGDFDGDGQLDFITAGMDASDPALRISDSATHLSVHKSSKKHVGQEIQLHHIPRSAHPGFKRTILASGDFDGDAMTDFVVADVNNKVTADPGIKKVLYRANPKDASGFSKLEFDIDPSVTCTWKVRGTGDFDGNRVSDILLEDCILYGRDPGSETPGFDARRHTMFGGTLKDVRKVYVGEFNGDGRSDIMAEFSAGKKNHLTNLFRFVTDKNNSFKQHTNVFGHWAKVKAFADFNGDGLSDVLISENTGTFIYASKGDGAITKWGSAKFNIGDSRKRIAAVGDFSGDGRADILVTGAIKPPALGYVPPLGYADRQASKGGILHVFNGFKFVPRKVQVGAIYHRIQAVGDLDGDGDADLLTAAVSPFGTIPTPRKFWMSSSNAAVVDEVSEIKNGLGSKTSVRYGRLRNPKIYDKGTFDMFSNIPPKYPYRAVTGAMVVVRKLITDNATNAAESEESRNETIYTYKNGREHLAGRGFLGFELMTTHDVTRKTKVNEGYAQAAPCTGMLRYRTFIVRAGTKQEQQVREIWFKNRYIFTQEDPATQAPPEVHDCFRAPEDALRDATIFTFAGVETERRWELGSNRDPTDVTETTRTFDGLGNQLTQERTLIDDSWTKTKREYNYNTKGKTWNPGRMFRETTWLRNSKGQSQQVSEYKYHKTKVRLERKLVGTPQELATVHEYDVFGNPVEKKVGFSTMRTINTHFYDQKGQFPYCSMNAVGHIEYRKRHPSFGVTTKAIDANEMANLGITSCEFDTNKLAGAPATIFKHDVFGEKTLEIRPDGTESSFEFVPFDPQGKRARYRTLTKTTGAPRIWKTFDRLGREIATVQDGQAPNSGPQMKIRTLVRYDKTGRVTKQSEPHVTLADGVQYETPQWSVSAYDALGRLTRLIAPNGVATEYRFDGREKTIIRDAGNRRLTKTTLTDAQGREVLITDEEDTSMSFVYDVDGNVEETRVHVPGRNDVVTRVKYNAAGHRTRLEDPDLGTWLYRYDRRGRLTYQEDAKGNQTTMKYDPLGRMTKRISPEGTSTWVYDELDKERAPGKIVAEIGPSTGFTAVRKYYYDELGRIFDVQMNVDGRFARIRHGYDSAGRVDKRSYIVGGKELYTLTNNYDARGFLTGVSGSDGKSWYSEARYDRNGSVSEYKNGAGAIIVQERNPKTRALEHIFAKRGSKTEVDLTMGYNSIGSMTSITNGIRNRKETFRYDRLQRLKSASFGPNGPWLKTNYDALGNVTSRQERFQDVKLVESDTTLHYDGPRPHAVTQAGTVQYSYDRNGNVIQRGNIGFEWTSFNKPSWMGTAQAVLGKARINSRFEYDAERNRIFQETVERTPKSLASHFVRVKEKTYYFTDFEGTNLYEKVCTANEDCTVNWTHDAWVIHVGGPNGPVGHIALKGPHDGERSYYYTNHLGSVIARTDTAGAITEEFDYDAWGRRRNPETAAPYTQTQSGPHWTDYGFADRGYTGHEMLDAIGLIHMNGRIYDPSIGRFISPDPFVQDRFDPQNLNRYTYVLNNPLVNVDPSGFFLKKLVKFIKKHLVTIIAGVLSIVTAGWALAIAASLKLSALASAAFSGFVSGFVGGFSGAVLNGEGLGSALKFGLKGALSSAATSFLTAAALQTIYRTLTPASKMEVELTHTTRTENFTLIRRNIPASEIEGQGIVGFINGQSNDIAKAARLGYNWGRVDEFYMLHNPTAGGRLDTIESMLGKVSGQTPVSKGIASILKHADLTKSHIFTHSQGGIITRNALVMARAAGQKMTGLTVSMGAAAVNEFSTKVLFSRMGVDIIDFFAHPYDAVPNITGFNAILPFNPYRLAGSVIFSDGLTVGREYSAHTFRNGGKLVRPLFQLYGRAPGGVGATP